MALAAALGVAAVAAVTGAGPGEPARPRQRGEAPASRPAKPSTAPADHWLGIAPYPRATLDPGRTTLEAKRLRLRFAKMRTPPWDVRCFATVDGFAPVVDHFRRVLGGEPTVQRGHLLFTELAAARARNPKGVAALLQRIDSKHPSAAARWVTVQVTDRHGVAELIVQSPILKPNAVLAEILSSPPRLNASEPWDRADVERQPGTLITIVRYWKNKPPPTK